MKPNQDSSKYYQNRMLSDMDMEYRSSGELKNYYSKKVQSDAENLERQKQKSPLFKMGKILAAKAASKTIGSKAANINDMKKNK